MPRTFLVLVSLLLDAGFEPAAAAPLPKNPSAAQIQQAIEDLGSPRFAVREKGSKFLWEAGHASEAALRTAATSQDEETAKRAQAILEKFDWGLYPDTPAALVKLIEKYRGGNADERVQVVAEMARVRPTPMRTLRKLAQREQDENTRGQVWLAMSLTARRVVPELLVAKQLDEAAELLELTTSPFHSASFRDHAAFHFLRQTLPEAIRRAEAASKTGNDTQRKHAATLLAYLHRARKDWPAARHAAKAAGDDLLEDLLAWEASDWQTLADSGPLPAEGDIRGARAAYQRLAGNQAKSAEIIAELTKELAGVEGGDTSASTLANALLLNGRGGDAVAILKERPKVRPELTFDLLCAQLKFKEAFALADRAAKELATDDGGFVLLGELDLQRAKVLANLGDRDAATQIFRKLLERSTNINRERNGVDVVQAALRVGMRDLAVECAATLLDKRYKDRLDFDVVQLLEELVGNRRYAAQVWWNAYRLAEPMEDPVKALRRVLALVGKNSDPKEAARLETLVAKLREQLGKNDDLPDVLQHIFPGPMLDLAVAEAYRAAGTAAKAEEFYKKAIGGQRDTAAPLEFFDDFRAEDDFTPPYPSRYQHLRAYADFLLEQKRWRDAADMYRKSWEQSPGQPLPLFLQGHALTLAGDKDEGTRLMTLAHWCPLGDDGVRSRFADDLLQRGFETTSKREIELMLATGWFQSHTIGNAYLRVARSQARAGDFAGAAALYDKNVVGLFRTAAVFVEPRAYLSVPELARTYRVRALFAAGKHDEAMTEARLGLANLPGHVELAINFVPDLQKAGKLKEADEIYGNVKTAFAAAIKDYANSAELRNSLAWTMVNCNRDLDEAQRHAEQAVKLTPTSAGYLDTLAEIHFRQKDRTKALELMKKCAALEPQNPYFRKQLERFEKKPFDSPLPDEETGDD